MSNKKVKGKMLQVLIEAKKKKNPGPQGINRGGRQPRMDFKGKPMGYFENRRSSTNIKVPLAKKGPHNIEKMPKVQILPYQAKNKKK